MREEAKLENRLIDATLGKKTKTLIITDSNHVIMSAINPETYHENRKRRVTMTKGNLFVVSGPSGARKINYLQIGQQNA